MPRRIIPIRTGPARVDFQDSASGLTDGLAQAIATLAALPMQQQQIQQDYALRTAGVDRENRRLDRQDQRDSLEDALRLEDRSRRDRLDASTLRNNDLSTALSLGVAPAGMEQDPTFQAAIGEHGRKRSASEADTAAKRHQDDLENALLDARTKDIGIRGMADAIGHIQSGMGVGKRGAQAKDQNVEAARDVYRNPNATVEEKNWARGILGIPQPPATSGELDGAMVDPAEAEAPAGDGSWMRDALTTAAMGPLGAPLAMARGLGDMFGGTAPGVPAPAVPAGPDPQDLDHHRQAIRALPAGPQRQAWLRQLKKEQPAVFQALLQAEAGNAQ